jgi:hypothetical protein
MTHLQIKWAKEHDWFVSCLVINRMKAVQVFDTYDQHYHYFTNYELLRQWAGY